MAANRRALRAFTLTELMVAVIVLIVVIVATSKIFGTASQVTGLGQAGAEVLQEAAAIERRMRADFEALSHEGFFAIRCVAVLNSVNLANGGALLDPEQPPDAVIRADQLVFFTNGVQSVQGFRAAAGMQRKGQGTAARIYYGPGFQVPQGPPADADDPTVTFAQDLVLVSTDPVVPWYMDLPPFRDLQQVRFQKSASDAPGDYASPLSAGVVNVTQPQALKWLLARQPVALVDDGGDLSTGGTNVYLASGGAGGVRTTKWIGDEVIVNGRVDAAAARLSNNGPSGLGGVRLYVTDDGHGTLRNWFPDQRNAIGDLVFYPRAERHAPGMNRVDQALTSHTLSAACSSFIVDWTYADGVGSTAAVPNGGVNIVSAEQPWFGLDPAGTRGVGTFESYLNFEFGNSVAAAPVYPDRIERVSPAPGISAAGAAIRSYAPGDIIVYEAFFGYNQERPFDLNSAEPLANSPGAYTPLPSAIRVTMTLHDPAGKLAAGRVVQMVFDLPRRG